MDFAEYLKAIAGNWKLLLAAALPATVSWIISLAPPWPDAAGNVSYAFAVVMSVVGILIPWALHRLRNRAWPVVACALLSLCLIMTYAACWSLWIGQASQRNGDALVEFRFVKGDQLTVPLKGTTERDVLRDNGYRVEDVYTPSSLLKTRLALLFSFAGTFFFITIAFAFATLPRGRSTGRPLAQKPG